MKKRLLQILKILAGVYLGVCILLYFSQEKILFFPKKLDPNYRFEFTNTFEEVTIRATDGTILNGVFFKADSSKGLIFYLHGNGGSIRSWGDLAKTYTDLHYDVFMLDYRGYGKSEGNIYSEEQVFQDNQIAYDIWKKKYSEDRIIVLGYSVGTGLAAKLASTNHPKLLLLQAPYYSLTDMMKYKYPGIPTFLLKYKFATNDYLKECTMPVVIFHGIEDAVIPYQSSERLQQKYPTQVTLISLHRQGHNGITENQVYLTELKKLLNK